MSAAASAPASSANLGPGFDCVAVALDLRCRVTVAPNDRWQLISAGREEKIGEHNVVVAATRAAGAESPLLIEVESDIPRARGLGSSAAVCVAAAAAAMRANGQSPDPMQLFDIVAELEGHADNAAAAVFGGCVAATGRTVTQLEFHGDLAMVVAVPELQLSTTEARQALPLTVPHEVAARSIARAVFLVEGLRTADASLLSAAAHDELHEEPRAALVPLSAELVEVATRSGALHAAWSGAGPAVLAFVRRVHADAVAAAMEATLDGAGYLCRPEVDTVGWQ